MKSNKLARIAGAIAIPAAATLSGCANTITHVIKGTATAVTGISKDILNAATYVGEHVQTDEEAKNNQSYTPSK